MFGGGWGKLDQCITITRVGVTVSCENFGAIRNQGYILAEELV
jgi:hypothetical protein